jgi:hypothetical protein
MKRQRGRRQLQSRCNLAGWQSLRAGLHQHAVDGQPMFMGERGKRGDGIDGFHGSFDVSRIVEIMSRCSPGCQAGR